MDGRGGKLVAPLEREASRRGMAANRFRHVGEFAGVVGETTAQIRRRQRVACAKVCRNTNISRLCESVNTFTVVARREARRTATPTGAETAKRGALIQINSPPTELQLQW